jgi:hypothetical protein
MKEGIYIILLQNRETAILNGAVVESNLKVLIRQNKLLIYFPRKTFYWGFLFSLLMPCDLPSFTIDTKIHTEEDILKQINDAAFLGTP